METHLLNSVWVLSYVVLGQLLVWGFFFFSLSSLCGQGLSTLAMGLLNIPQHTWDPFCCFFLPLQVVSSPPHMNKQSVWADRNPHMLRTLLLYRFLDYRAGTIKRNHGNLSRILFSVALLCKCSLLDDPAFPACAAGSGVWLGCLGFFLHCHWTETLSPSFGLS